MAVYEYADQFENSWRRSTKGNWYSMNLRSLILELVHECSDNQDSKINCVWL